VAPEEMAGAILRILAAAFSIRRGDLTIKSARLLGYDRTGSRVSLAIDNAIGELLNRNVVLDTGGQIRIRE